MATIQNVTDNRPDGAHIGLSTTEKIGFFGTTPAVQQTGFTAMATLVGTVAVSDSSRTTAGVWGAGSSTVLKALGTNLKSTAAKVNQIRTALVTLGLISDVS